MRSVGRFAYYNKLKAAERRVYERSDSITELALPDIDPHRLAAGRLAAALETAERARVQRAAEVLSNGILRSLGAPPLVVRVLAQRPKNAAGELHGLYTLEESGRAQIEVWMRTAANRRVVAFRTFLRTLVHELCHHLDLTVLGLADTFHTEGFFRRESSVVRQLLGPGAARARTPRAAPPPDATVERPTARPRGRRPRQLSLFD